MKQIKQILHIFLFHLLKEIFHFFNLTHRSTLLCFIQSRPYSWFSFSFYFPTVLSFCRNVKVLCLTAFLLTLPLFFGTEPRHDLNMHETSCLLSRTHSAVYFKKLKPCEHSKEKQLAHIILSTIFHIYTLCFYKKLRFLVQTQPLQLLYEKSLCKIFHKIHRKTVVPDSFFKNKDAGKKRNSGTGVILWILRNF